MASTKIKQKPSIFIGSYRNKESKNDLFNRLRTADIKKFKIHAKNDFKRLKTRLMNGKKRKLYRNNDNRLLS